MNMDVSFVGRPAHFENHAGVTSSLLADAASGCLVRLRL